MLESIPTNESNEESSITIAFININELVLEKHTLSTNKYGNITFPHLPSKKLKYSLDNKSSESDCKEYEKKKPVFLILLKDTERLTLDSNPVYVRKMVKASDAPVILDYMKEYVPDKTL